MGINQSSDDEDVCQVSVNYLMALTIKSYGRTGTIS